MSEKNKELLLIFTQYSEMFVAIYKGYARTKTIVLCTGVS